jgi:hypothetical protein
MPGRKNGPMRLPPGIVVGDPVYLEGRAGHKFLTIYTEAPNAQAGLVIVHGIGVHPDHGLISTLRIALADHGYTTPVCANAGIGWRGQA